MGTFLFVCLVIAVSSLLLLFYKDSIKIWMYSNSWSRALFSEDMIDKDKPYDAFLSYAQADSDFVEKELLKGEGYVLHLSFTNMLFHQAWRALRT